MLRSSIGQTEAGQVSRSARLLARTDQQGKLATALAPVVNATARFGPARIAMEKVTGIARDRLLPTYHRVRFSKWFHERPRRRPAAAAPERGPVALFPTCLDEYQEPAIGKAAVAVFEHNGFTCELPGGQVCCGMPWLDAGDADRFRDAAQRNVDALLPVVEAGRSIIVPQPTCAYTVKDEYPAFLGTEAARKVSAATFDAAEFLMNAHRGRDKLDTNFEGTTYETITWHAACHYRAQQIGPRSSQLMQLTGAKVQMVERCSGIDGTWGLRAENVEMAQRVAKPLMERVRGSKAELIAGDCQLANVAIDEATGKRPVHPLQVLARAYGIEEDGA
jgi:Fe-S oxidoreductase